MTAHHGSIVGGRDSLQVINCTDCGFCHLWPIPDDDIYANGTYHSEIKPSMAADYDASRPWWHMLYEDWLDMISWRLPGPPNLLDVGAGTGEFVRFANGRNWKAIGLEPDEHLALAYNLVGGPYSGHSFLDFSVITAFWVMEHLSDPSNFLKWVYSSLTSKGVFAFAIPNDFTSLQLQAARAVNQPWYWVHHTHVNYWNKSTVVPFVEKHGFTVVDCYGSWMPESYLIHNPGSKNYLKNPEIGLTLHKRRMESELSMPKQERMSRMRMRGMMSWGRDIFYVAVKNG